MRIQCVKTCILNLGHWVSPFQHLTNGLRVKMSPPKSPLAATKEKDITKCHTFQDGEVKERNRNFCRELTITLQKLYWCPKSEEWPHHVSSSFPSLNWEGREGTEMAAGRCEDTQGRGTDFRHQEKVTKTLKQGQSTKSQKWCVHPGALTTTWPRLPRPGRGWSLPGQCPSLQSLVS